MSELKNEGVDIREEFRVWAKNKANDAGGIALVNPFDLIHQFYKIKLDLAMSRIKDLDAKITRLNDIIKRAKIKLEETHDKEPNTPPARAYDILSEADKKEG